MLMPEDLLEPMFLKASPVADVLSGSQSENLATQEALTSYLNDMEQGLKTFRARMTIRNAEAADIARTEGPNGISAEIDKVITSYREKEFKAANELAEHATLMSHTHDYFTPELQKLLRRNEELLHDRYETLRMAWVSLILVRAGINHDWMMRLKLAISTFAKDSSMTIAQATADQAREVLRQLPADLPKPQVVPSVDGDVILLWYNHGDHVEMNLGPDGHLVWFGRFGDTYEPGGDIAWQGHMPPSAETMLRRLRL